MAERVLVNFFYANPVGHAVEALHYCHGHHLADPAREISVAMSAATPVALAAFCPFVSAAYAIDHPLLEPCPDSARRLTALPREWDWVLDNHRRWEDFQLAVFPGLRDYYVASDRHLAARRGHMAAGARAAGYVAHRQLRFVLPERARAAAAARLAERAGRGSGRIAVMPAGSAERSLYPSLSSWLAILDALADAFDGVQIVLVGKLRRDARTATSMAADELAGLRAHRLRPLDCFDADLAEQLAVVEACDLFLAPHTGFGLAALAVGTPWLALSGGRWFEYFFNHVPFRSVLPDTERYPSFTQLRPAAIADDGDEGRRTPSMSRGRIKDDLGRIVTAAGELLRGELTYEQSLRDYFSALPAALGGDSAAIWSIDDVHRDHVPAR